jgi:hypothetical protein
MMLLGIISMVISSIVTGYFSLLINESPFLFGLPVVFWRSRNYFYVVFLFGIPIALDEMTARAASSWIHFLWPVLTLIIGIYLFPKLFLFPMTGIVPNAFNVGLVVGTMISALFAIIRLAGGVIPQDVNSTVPFGVVLITFGIIYVPMSRRRSEIMAQLSYQRAFPDGNEITDAARQTYLSGLNIRDVGHAFCYLQLAVEDGCDFLVDGSLFAYLSENFTTDEDLMVFLILVVSFFPHEAIPLRPLVGSRQLAALSSVMNRSMVYQLHRIHVFRQSSTSRQVAADFTRVERLAEGAIALHCDFWRSLGSSTPSNDDSPQARARKTAQTFARLTAARINGETAWADVLDRHPNNARLFDEFSVFLLEVRCDFTAAVRWHQRARGAESRRDHDRLFRAFVAAFPFYIRRGIIDSHGKLSPPMRRLSADHAMDPAQEPIASGSSGELDSARLDVRAADELLECPQLRMAMRQCIDSLHSPVQFRIQVFSIVRFVLSIGFALLIALALDAAWTGDKSLFRHIRSAIEMHEAASLAMGLLPLGWMRQAFGRGDNYWDELPGLLNATANSRLLVLNLSIQGLSLGDSLSRTLYLRDYSEGEESIALATKLTRDLSPSLVCEANTLTAIDDPSNASINYLFREFFLTSARVAMRCYARSFALCSQVLRGLSLSDSIRSLTAAISPPIAEFHKKNWS